MQADYMIEGRSFSIPEVFFDIFNDRFGLGHIGTALSLVPCIAMLNATVMFMVTSSRSELPSELPHSLFESQVP